MFCALSSVKGKGITMKKRIRIIISTIAILLISNSAMVYAAPWDEENTFSKDLMTYEECVEVVYHADIYEKEAFSRATRGVSDIPITEEMLNLIEVTSTDEEGNIEELDVYMTVKEIGHVMQNGEIGTFYMLSAFASTKDDSGTASYSKTTAQGTVFWIDNPGVNNELFGVSGSWTTNGDSLSDRRVEYGADNDWSKIKTKYPTSNTYAYTEKAGSIMGLLLHLTSYITVNGQSLRLRVTSSIFT